MWLTGRVRAPGGAELGSFPFAGIERIAAGGRLVVVLPGTADDGLTGFQDLFDHANAMLAEMVPRALSWPRDAREWW